MGRYPKNLHILRFQKSFSRFYRSRMCVFCVTDAQKRRLGVRENFYGVIFVGCLFDGFKESVEFRFKNFSSSFFVRDDFAFLDLKFSWVFGYSFDVGSSNCTGSGIV